ncbi:MAG TPA: hypothetical protein VHM30_16830, partial [Gemmatimonadaceae bacterium]|nr:hypothetical protein [Gemmatimonadaceae bacterium]
MLSLPPLLLHELFPQFPPLWFILLSGVILGVGLAALARRHRRPTITTLAAAKTMPCRAPGEDAPRSALRQRLREIRETLGDEILGVPWSVPGYALIFVVGSGLASAVVPPLGIALLPGYIAIWAIAMSFSLPDSGLLGELLAIAIMVGFSWAFWTGGAMFGWHLLRILRRDPVPDRRVRLDL